MRRTERSGLCDFLAFDSRVLAAFRALTTYTMVYIRNGLDGLTSNKGHLMPNRRVTDAEIADWAAAGPPPETTTEETGEHWTEHGDSAEATRRLPKPVKSLEDIVRAF